MTSNAPAVSQASGEGSAEPRLNVVERATVVATEAHGQLVMTVLNVSVGGGTQEDFCAQVPGLTHVWVGNISGAWGAKQMYQIVADSGACRDVGYLMFEDGSEHPAHQWLNGMGVRRHEEQPKMGVIMWRNSPFSGGKVLWTSGNGGLAKAMVELIGGVWAVRNDASTN
ncbi:hypothetical protein ACJ41O_013268 [Fusarium nematophilum]